ncbi:MAG: preprotein translocase subunit YajC [Acidobacteriota bacterium]
MPSAFMTLAPFSILAQGAAPAGNSLMSWVPMILIFAVFYLVLFLPMRRRQKALQNMIANLKKGDRVYTNGGLYGEVSSTEGSTVILKVAQNVKVKVAKSAIAGLEGQEEGQRQ